MNTSPSPASPQTPRDLWLAQLTRLAGPVLKAAQSRTLTAAIPRRRGPGERTSISLVDTTLSDHRVRVSGLEATARTLAGMAPWLESAGDGARVGARLNGDECQAVPERGTSKPAGPTENILRSTYAKMAQDAVAAVVDPKSPDYCHLGGNGQPFQQELVEAAFLGQAILRAPQVLFDQLSSTVRQQLVNELIASRCIRPPRNNWLLFAAMVEAALAVMGQDPDMTRIDYALQQHEQWYVGDGTYSDGPHFHWDYYNSFVIHPMLLDILHVVAERYPETRTGPIAEGTAMRQRFLDRTQRYATALERMIAVDGSFPAIGRSLAYRCGAFHALAHLALLDKLPDALAPSQVRCALQAVITRTLEAEGTFDEQGWLNIGLAGDQPGLGEPYITTGSLYLCTTAFLPLGLPADSEFWAAPAISWSSQKIWSGQNAQRDKAAD